MPSPLPAPYIDCNIPASYTFRAALQLAIKQTRQAQVTGQYSTALLSAAFTPFPPPPPFTIATMKEVTLYASLTVPIDAFHSSGGSAAVEEADGSDPGVAGPLSALYTYTETGGPYRIGAAFADDVNGTMPQPTNGNIERANYVYALFEDENTVWSYTFGDLTATRQAQGVSDAIPVLYFSAACFSQTDVTNAVEFRFTNLSLDGSPVDASGLADGAGTGTAGGAIQVTNNAAFQGGVGGQRLYTFAPPVRCNLNVDVQDYAGTGLGAKVVTSWTPTELTTPTALVLARTVASWDYPGNVIPTDQLAGPPVEVKIPSAWLQSKGLHADDHFRVPIFASPPRLSPAQAHTYLPAKITVSARLPVLVSANAWQSSDAAKIAVSGGTFTVHATGANVFRALKENWRAWVGLGTGGQANAEFALPRYNITKHDYLTGGANAGQDVWSWASHASLELKLDCRAAGTLTLQVTGVGLAVTDLHEADMPTRLAHYATRVTAFTKNYPFAVVAGPNTVTLDLLFPAEGGPFLYGRVDRVQLSGFPTGDYTLSQFDLVTREDTYLKVDWDRQFMGVHASQDGAGPMLNLPDGYRKEDETGDAGGALRLREPVNSGGSAPDVTPKSLAAFLDEWDRIEGWSVVYDAAASDAAMKDSSGNRVNEEATFLPQLVPHVRLTPGTLYQPPCAVRCGSIRFPNVSPGSGNVWQVSSQFRLGAALEAQTATADLSARGAAGVTVYAARVSDGARVASGTSDNSGYVSIAVPLPPGDVAYRLESDS